MTMKELKAELKIHSISLEGMFEKSDLISACATARNDNAGARVRSKLEGMAAETAAASTGAPRPRGRRQTVDSTQSGLFSANPQQPLGRSEKRPSSRGSSGQPSPRNSYRSLSQSRTSSFSSLGDPNLDGSMEENNGMAVLNAPLGVGLSGLAQDVQNPNQQMGLLLLQMKELEERMSNPAEQQNQQQHQQQWRQLRRNSNATNSNSRRRSTSSVQSVASSGMNGGSFAGGAQSRRGRDLSGRSGNTWFVGTDPNSNNASSATSGNSNYHNSDGSKKMNRHPSGPGGGQQGIGAPHHSGTSLKNSGVISLVMADNAKEAGTETKGVLGLTNDKVKVKKKSCSKKYVCIALLVAGLALAVALVFVFVIDKTGDSDGQTTTLINGEKLLPSLGPTSPPQYLEEEPPFDIEGRCSPSNLPGSLEACAAACSPSACCYPNNQQGVKSCVDEGDERSVDACRRYWPYCDIFYDAWLGAENGVLRTPNANIARMCTAESNVEDNAEEIVTMSEEFERKRLRGHETPHQRRMETIDTPDQVCQQHCKSARCCHAPSSITGAVLSASGVYTDAERGHHVVRNCQEDFGKNKGLCRIYDEFCNGYFSSANGTSLVNEGWTSPTLPPILTTPPTVSMVPSSIPSSRPSSMPSDNVLLGPSIMPTDNAFTGIWTSRPTHSPTDSSSPTASSSPTHSLSPSDDSLPTLQPEEQEDPYQPTSIPTSSSYPTTSNLPSNAPSPFPTILPAPSLEVAASCSGTENEEMISAGMSPARNNCIIACQNGLCCYPEMLGHGSWMSSCYAGNEAICLEYYPCLVLAQGKNVASPNISTNVDVVNNVTENTVAGNNTIVYTNTTTDTIAAPPIPAQNLTALCSQDFISTLVGLEECERACQPGSCCNAQQEESSCYADNLERCALYQPCTKDAKPQNNPPAAQEEPELPPAASPNLSTVCSYEALASSATYGVECFQLCRQGSCCSNGSCLEDANIVSQTILDSVAEICETYRPCANLNLLTTPPSNLDEVCDRSTPTSDECATICSSVSCCFSGSPSYINETNSTYNNSSSSCYLHFEETCLGYAPYCDQPSTSEPSTATVVTLPPPPQDLEAICSFSPAFCEEVCGVASCCFESSSELNCFASNEERCDEYSICATLYDQES
eukprot:CAMPEP_0172327768 /NCGR_PEP_ID=MMETSP1058-20130122/60003_1 /TAXON_ID=83371 /ORGANISM="Detonula confervacea, Strain CCMP 353" /LENGTH=1143 /DNA_ID=CAMNT_0013044853 /DNA_START=83 /DNA_END=3514 /DNA_ORIENTATION=+